MEGEPASDKDALLLLQSPHLVLDGAQLVAAACGARGVVVCVPESRDHVAATALRAVAERLSARWAPVPETMVRPPERFVAGEESALVEWISPAGPCLRSDTTRALRSALAATVPWYTTLRRLPMWR